MDDYIYESGVDSDQKDEMHGKQQGERYARAIHRREGRHQAVEPRGYTASAEKAYGMQRRKQEAAEHGRRQAVIGPPWKPGPEILIRTTVENHLKKQVRANEQRKIQVTRPSNRE